MWLPYPYLWTLALLWLQFHTVHAARLFYIDTSCPRNVRDAVYEAIFDLLPRAYSMRDDERLRSIMEYIYPELNYNQDSNLFRMFTPFTPTMTNPLYNYSYDSC